MLLQAPSIAGQWVAGVPCVQTMRHKLAAHTQRQGTARAAIGGGATGLFPGAPRRCLSNQLYMSSVANPSHAPQPFAPLGFHTSDA